MPALPTGLRGYLRLTVRGRTLAGGVALGTVLLLVTTLISGVGRMGQVPEPPASGSSERIGPMTAVQPELREALLTGQDLPDTGPQDPDPDPGSRPAAPRATPSATPGGPERADEPPPLAGLCRALFEDPDGLPVLWPATPPQETTSRHTVRPGGATLRQVLSVFDTEEAPEAYGRLQEAATGCDRFTAVLDGAPVTVLLRRLTPESDRHESAGAAETDEGYAWQLTVRVEAPDEEPLTGWLTVDRVGPVISVLRQLGPEEVASEEERVETRTTALDKLRSLLRLLDR